MVKNKNQRFVVALLILFSTSCQPSYLRVRTEVIDESYHALSHVGAPNLCTPPLCGEQLVIRFRGAPMSSTLFLSLRLPDQSVVSLSREVTTSRGYWLYRLPEPILGYQVKLYQGECCLSTFSHLWAEPILPLEP